MCQGLDAAVKGGCLQTRCSWQFPHAGIVSLLPAWTSWHVHSWALLVRLGLAWLGLWSPGRLSYPMQQWCFPQWGRSPNSQNQKQLLRKYAAQLLSSRSVLVVFINFFTADCHSSPKFTSCLQVLHRLCLPVLQLQAVRLLPHLWWYW